MRVLGKDKTAEAYRIAIDLDGSEVVALLPDALLSAEYGQTDKVSHQAAYEWIEAQANGLRAAITALAQGAKPTAPFSLLTLERAP